MPKAKKILTNKEKAEVEKSDLEFEQKVLENDSTTSYGSAYEAMQTETLVENTVKKSKSIKKVSFPKIKLKGLIICLVFIVICTGVVAFLNKDGIDALVRKEKVITPETYESVKSDLKVGDPVRITGTPNFLHQVEQVPNTKGSSLNKYYFVALNEYNFDFIVRIKPEQFINQKQEFSGILKRSGDSIFGNKLVAELNRPLDFNQKQNEQYKQYLNSILQQKLSEETKSDFNEKTMLIQDGDKQESNEVIANIIFWSFLSSTFLIVFYRKRVFY